MEGITYPTFEDLLKLDDLEFIRLDVDINTYMYRPLYNDGPNMTEQQPVFPAPVPAAPVYTVPVPTAPVYTVPVPTAPLQTVPYQHQAPQAYYGMPETPYERVAGQAEKMIPEAKEKIYQCEICGKTYLNPRSLTNHSFVHTGVHPYSCEMCHRGFRYHSKLKEHQRREPYCRRTTKNC